MDPQYQQQPPQYGQPQFQQQAGASGSTHGMSSLISGLGSDIMAGLTYLVGILWIVGLVLQIVVFSVEKNRYVKFHAAQAMILGIVEAALGIIWFIVNTVLFAGASLDSTGAAGLGAFAVSGLVGCALTIVGLVLLGFWIWGMIGAFTGKATKLPVIGSYAERLAGGTEGTI